MINYSLFVELCDLVEKYKDRYEESKRSHIEKVITNGKKLFYSGMFPTLPDLFLSELESHDNTKFYSDEYFGAVLRHAVNFCGAKYPSKEIEDFANMSIDTHKKLNSHHPESFLNPNDMTLMHLALMISDWEAVASEEKNTTREWWNKVKMNYNFDDEHVYMIERLIWFFENYS